MPIGSTRVRNLSNLKFGRLTVLSFVGTNKWHNAIWHCICSCGKEIDVLQGNLVRSDVGTKSCGCYSQERTRKRPYEALYGHFITTSKGHDVDLSYEDFLVFTNVSRCHYCHAEVHWQKYNKQHSSRYNLDRKDNLLGYTNENCVVCCKRCNYAKGSKFSYEEWYGMTEYFRNQAKKVAAAIKGSPTKDAAAPQGEQQ